jgi:Glycosyltransferase family 10 (fucosyltransferase) C-term
MEPSEKIGNVSNSFLDQFSCVVTTDINVRHSNVIHANFHTWWAGINVAHKNNKHLFSSCVNLDYDDFISQMYSLNNKLSRICCIVSNKSFLPGHVNRLDMVKELINSPVGQYIDLYGSIGQPFSDKYQVQSRYKYSLVLENTILPHYWSEKLADSFLARSYPFYLGCPNIEKYFDEDSMTIINDMTPPQVSEAILKALDADLFSQKVTSIFSSMRKVLDEYNIFNQMARLSIGPTSGRKHIMLKPNIYFVENRLERFRRKLSLAKRFATRSL